MGVRGPKSKNDLTVVPPDSEGRVAPPEWLDDDAKAEWNRIVDSLPAYHFDETQLGLLEQYVRHRIEATHISQLIQAATHNSATDLVHYDRLLKMQERESRILASLAVRLGFAKSTAKHADNHRSGGLRPWE